MAKTSAGILLYRIKNNLLEVLLVHPGGPFWAKKDAGTWSVPKGEFETAENPLDAAKRELLEETGIKAIGPFIELTPIKQRAGKMVYTWAMQFDIDATTIKSNSFSMEWPLQSGQIRSFPEIDKAAWFNLEKAKYKILKAQFALILELHEKIHTHGAALVCA